MIGFGLSPDKKLYRDKKLMIWSIYPPSAATADSPATGWDARSSNYDPNNPVRVVNGTSLEELIKGIDAYVATHPFRVNRTDAEGLALLGVAGFIGGGAIAAGASLFGFPRIAKLGGAKALLGLGFLGVGVVLSDRIKTEHIAKLQQKPASPLPQTVAPPPAAS